MKNGICNKYGDADNNGIQAFHMTKNAIFGFGLLQFFGSSIALAQQTRSDSNILKNDVMLALELVADPTISATIRPYVDCYSMSVESSSFSSLKDDHVVQNAEHFAQEHCKDTKDVAIGRADATLAIRSPHLSPIARADLLRRVRRQAILFGLISRYQIAHRGKVFQRYLERMGREARAGRAVVMLSGE